MTFPSSAPALQSPASDRLVSWLLGALLAALGGVSLLGYDLGRPLLVWPVLGGLALAVLPRLFPLKMDLPFRLGLSAGVFLLVSLFNCAVLHPDQTSPATLTGWLMLTAGWAAFAAGLHDAPRKIDIKPILWGLALVEAVLVGQIWLSFFTNWGETINTRDGFRRAYGWAGDGYSSVLVFIVLLNLLRRKSWRAVAGIIALFMTGGKMSIGLTLIAATLALPLVKTRKHLLATVAVGCVLGILILEPAKLATAPPAHAAVMPTQSEEKSNTSALSYMVNASTATGLGRMISIGAGWHMLTTHPWSGVGYGQSARSDIFREAVLADAFDLKTRLGIPEIRLTAEADISNQTMIVAAELGLPGLVAFLVLAGFALLLCFRCWQRLRRYGPLQEDAHLLVATCAIWGGVLIVFNQTAPWLLPGAAPTLLLCLALGLCASFWRRTC